MELVELQLILIDEFADFFFILRFSRVRNLTSQCRIVVCGFYQTTQKFMHAYIRMGRSVAQLVEALRCKSEGRGFDSRWCHWNFSLT